MPHGKINSDNIAGQAVPAQLATTSLRVNNFDLIRLLASTQVLLVHLTWYFFPLPTSGLGKFLIVLFLNFPGIPIFFVISGYLISLSWERSGSARTYATNRCLRIFPGLWVCLIVTILVMLASGYLSSVVFSVQDFIRWIFWQSTVGQVYTIGMFNDFGTGIPNGTLWSIPVEMQFYVFLPLLYLVLPRNRRAFLISVAVLAIVTAIMSEWIIQTIDPSSTLGFRVYACTGLPYCYMFLLGIIIQRLLPILMPVLRNMFLPWLALYLFVVFGLHYGAGWMTGIRLGTSTPPILVVVILAMTTISAAFTWPSLSGRLLRGNDISYGTYIYQMVFINLVFYLEITNMAWQITITVLATYTCAILSWRFVERPSLSRKRHTLRSDGPTTTAAAK